MNTGTGHKIHMCSHVFMLAYSSAPCHVCTCTLCVLGMTMSMFPHVCVVSVPACDFSHVCTYAHSHCHPVCHSGVQEGAAHGPQAYFQMPVQPEPRLTPAKKSVSCGFPKQVSQTFGCCLTVPTPTKPPFEPGHGCPLAELLWVMTVPAPSSAIRDILG